MSDTFDLSTGFRQLDESNRLFAKQLVNLNRWDIGTLKRDTRSGSKHGRRNYPKNLLIQR